MPFVGCGFSVNTAKYCHNSLVREACGSWWYASIDARIDRLKFRTASSISEWVSLLQSCKQLHEKGFSAAAEEILKVLDTVYPVPFGHLGLPGDPRVLFMNRSAKDHRVRWNSNLQRLEFLMPFLTFKKRRHNLPGPVGLYAYFTKQESQPVFQGDEQFVDWDYVALERT